MKPKFTAESAESAERSRALRARERDLFMQSGTCLLCVLCVLCVLRGEFCNGL